MASRQPNFVLLDSSQAEIARLISCKLVMRSNVDRGRIRKSLRKPPRDRHSPGSPDKRGPPSPSSYGRHRSSRYDRADTSDRKSQLRRAPISKLLCVRTCFSYGVRASARQPLLRGSLDLHFSSAGTDGFLLGAEPAFPFAQVDQRLS